MVKYYLKHKWTMHHLQRPFLPTKTARANPILCVIIFLFTINCQALGSLSARITRTSLANCYCRIIALESRQILEHLDFDFEFDCHLPCMELSRLNFATHHRQLLPAWPYTTVITQHAPCSFPPIFTIFLRLPVCMLFPRVQLFATPWSCLHRNYAMAAGLPVRPFLKNSIVYSIQFCDQQRQHWWPQEKLSCWFEKDYNSNKIKILILENYDFFVQLQ